MAPELDAVTPAAVLGFDQKQTHESVGLAIAHPGNSADGFFL
jgi:hypothetical protein